jgi:hypothetical protein
VSAIILCRTKGKKRKKEAKRGRVVIKGNDSFQTADLVQAVMRVRRKNDQSQAGLNYLAAPLDFYPRADASALPARQKRLLLVLSSASLG